MANGNGDSKKRKISLLDEQFDFPPIPNWRAGQKQKQLGSELIKHDPKEPVAIQPIQVDFEIKDHDEIWSFGPNTRFKIKGQFQVEGNAGTWTPVPLTENKKMIVCPNWMDCLIKTIDIFHGNVRINSSDEGRCVAPYLNAWKYNYMSKKQKKLLCPQGECPAYGVPSKVGDAGWSMAAGSEWVDGYSKEIFKAGVFSFDYIPLDLPPFFQGTNYMEEPQKILPMPLLDKLTVRIIFHDHLDSIFKNEATNLKKYRFAFSEVSFVAEHMRLSTPFKNSILKKQGHLPFNGVTRIMKSETVPAGNMTHKSKVQSIAFPEGIFIFAVPKEVPIGTYKYQSNNDGNVFSWHNITDVNFTYGEQGFFLNQPYMGMINEDVIENKLFFDYLLSPPFGMKMDWDKVLLKDIKAGAKSTPYPHVYLNLCNYGDKTRIIPFLNDGSILNKNNDLELTLTFGTEGAPANITYIIYLYYTDNNLTLDTKHKNQSYFTSPHIKLI